MKLNLVQNNFTAGEISPRVQGRSDLSKYKNGAGRVCNKKVLVQGGLQRRQGTVQAFQGTSDGILVPFVFSTDQSYVLEFTPGLIRIYNAIQRTLLYTGPTPYSVVSPYLEEDLSKLKFRQSADVLFIFHPNYQTRKLSRYGELDWRMSLFETKDGPYSANALVDVTLKVSGVSDKATLKSSAPAFSTSPTDVGKFVEFRENDVWRLGKITAVNSPTEATIDYRTDLLLQPDNDFFVSAETNKSSEFGRVSPLAKLTSGSVTTLDSDRNDTFTGYDIGKYVRLPGSSGGSCVWKKITDFNGIVSSVQRVTIEDPSTITPLYTYSYPTTILTVSNRQISATVTASSPVFSATDVGRHITLNYSGARTWGIITAFTSASVVSVTFYETVPADPSNATALSNEGVTDDWKLGAWSQTTGWPSMGTFHEGRLWCARTNKEPSAVWASVVDDFHNFAPSDLDSQVQDTSSMTFTLASNQNNEICWLNSGPVLLLGTTSSEWAIRSNSIGSEPVTPTNFQAKEQSFRGSSPFSNAHRIGSSTVFLQRSGEKTLEAVYDFAQDAFTTADLTLLAEHILRDGGGAVTSIAHITDNAALLVLRADGKIAHLTYDRGQEVVGWSLFEFAYPVKSMVAVPGPENKEDLYILVEESSGYYVDRLTQDQFGTSAKRYLVDAGTYFSNPSTSVSGLSRFNGELVHVVADGAYRGICWVSSGQAVLPDTGSDVWVGRHYDSYVDLLPPEVDLQSGGSVGRLRSIHSANVKLFETLGGKVEGDPLESDPPRYYGIPNTLVTESLPVHIPSQFQASPAIRIVQDTPNPMTVLSVNLQVFYEESR